MAVQASLTDTQIKLSVRRPATVAILTTITLGIYSIVWYYRINREMRDFGAIRGDYDLSASRPWLSLTAFTLGGLIVIPGLVSLVGTVRRVHAVERIATGAARPAFGLTSGAVCAGLLPLGVSVHRFGTLIALAGLVALATTSSLIQARLNAAWDASGATAAARH